MPRQSRSFNSRAREGRDVYLFKIVCESRVSIHAPARGATVMPCTVIRKGDLFQFTRPRGARLAMGHILGWIDIVSIHAPARGATHI